MPLSSNTLFHLTNEKSSLQGILEKNFCVHYCGESIELATQSFQVHIPMVSFCDIPLSEIKDHISKYGKYGIGLTKEWAQRHGLNPVLYMEPKSLLAHSYADAFYHVVTNDATDFFTDGQRSLVDVLRYIKNYQADLTRKGKTTLNYRFSDEREWRYVPPSTSDCEMLVDSYNYYSIKETIDIKLEPIRLEFEPNDIKFIIIQFDSEIEEFVQLLRTAKGKKYSYRDIERLTTRLLTTEQILGDI